LTFDVPGSVLPLAFFRAAALDFAVGVATGCVAIRSAGRASSDMKRTAYITTE
jgi:hypothetical protein